MSRRLTEQELARLPVKVREHIAELTSEAALALKRLHDFEDAQSKSAFSYQDHVWEPGKTGPQTVTRYVQTHIMEVEHGGVWLRVLTRPDSPSSEECIEISWGEAGTYQGGHAAFVPTSFQQASLIHPNNLRFRQAKSLGGLVKRRG